MSSTEYKYIFLDKEATEVSPSGRPYNWSDESTARISQWVDRVVHPIWGFDLIRDTGFRPITMTFTADDSTVVIGWAKDIAPAQDQNTQRVIDIKTDGDTILWADKARPEFAQHCGTAILSWMKTHDDPLCDLRFHEPLAPTYSESQHDLQVTVFPDGSSNLKALSGERRNSGMSEIVSRLGDNLRAVFRGA